jgi:glycosyltransferase involved in cell wall biosynthesis
LATPVPVSVIVNNYNYGRFLKEAIDSALHQSYPGVEVIVVDDGSTDHSREIIASYGDRIIPVLKENGGQASAFNAGFATSRGEVIFFLDSDDALLPTAVKRVVPLFQDADVVKVHWHLRGIDKNGEKTGKREPRGTLPQGDLRGLVVREGPASHRYPPTTGNAWARRFLERVFPVPEAEFKIAADLYVLELAPLFGLIKSIPEPQGFYRLHGQNNYNLLFGAMIQSEVGLYNSLIAVMRKRIQEWGLDIDLDAWRRKSWHCRLERAMLEMANVIRPKDPFILVDQDEWGMTDGAICRPIPFLERNGQYWGKPPDDASAIRELKRLRRSGAKFMVFGWPAFWWFDYYSGLRHYLRSQFPCVLENERLVVFDLRG